MQVGLSNAELGVQSGVYEEGLAVGEAARSLDSQAAPPSRS